MNCRPGSNEIVRRQTTAIRGAARSVNNRIEPTDRSPESSPGLIAKFYARIYAERDCWFFMADPDSHKLPAFWATGKWFAIVIAMSGILVANLLRPLLSSSAADDVPNWATFIAGLSFGLVIERAITPHEDVQSQYPQLMARYKAPSERVKTWLVLVGVPLALTILALMFL